MSRATRSTRSTRGEEDFIVDDNEPPPLGEVVIHRYDDWAVVKDKLSESGWRWQKGNGLHDWFWFKPGIPTYKGYQQGVDYFVRESHLKKYVVQKYGWKDRVENDQNGSKRNKALPTKTKNTPTSILKPKGTSRKSGHQLPKPQSKNQSKRKISTSNKKELKSTHNVIERDAVQPIASNKKKQKNHYKDTNMPGLS